MEKIEFNQDQLNYILEKIYPKSKVSVWDKFGKLIPTIAIIIGGLWTFYLYFSHEKEKNEVLLEISNNQKELSELQTEQTRINNLNLELRKELLSKETILKEFDIQSIDLKRKLSLNEIKIQELNQKSIGLKSNLDISNERINQLAINSNVARSLDWSFAITSNKTRDLKFRNPNDMEIIAIYNEDKDDYDSEYDTIEEIKKEISKNEKINVLTEYLIDINVNAKNNGKQEVTLGKNSIIFYKGRKVENDSTLNKIYKINTPFEEFDENAISWEKIEELSYTLPSSEEFGISNRIGINELKSNSYQFYLNIEPEYILGIEINLENSIEDKNYTSRGFKIVNHNKGTSYNRQYIGMSQPITF